MLLQCDGLASGKTLSGVEVANRGGGIVKKVTLFSLLLGVLVLGACDGRVNLSPKGRSMTDEDLIAKILYEGDTAAYNTFYNKYADNGTAEFCLAYSLVMANKYHYPLARTPHFCSNHIHRLFA